VESRQAQIQDMKSLLHAGPDEAGGRITMKPFSASLVILWLALGLLAPAPTAGQSESPEAKELARLTLSPDASDMFITQAAKGGALPVKAVLEGRLGRRLTEDESTRLNEVFLRVFKETILPSDYEALFVDLFARYYSPQELKDLVAFYRSPLGMKTLRFSSVSREETGAWIRRTMAGHQREFVERLNAEFARELPALNQELEHKQRQ
jgi:uncharacterized protein